MIGGVTTSVAVTLALLIGDAGAPVGLASYSTPAPAGVYVDQQGGLRPDGLGISLCLIAQVLFANVGVSINGGCAGVLGRGRANGGNNGR